MTLVLYSFLFYLQENREYSSQQHLRSTAINFRIHKTIPQITKLQCGLAPLSHKREKEAPRIQPQSPFPRYCTRHLGRHELGTEPTLCNEAHFKFNLMNSSEEPEQRGFGVSSSQNQMLHPPSLRKTKTQTDLSFLAMAFPSSGLALLHIDRHLSLFLGSILLKIENSQKIKSLERKKDPTDWVEGAPPTAKSALLGVLSHSKHRKTRVIRRPGELCEPGWKGFPSGSGCSYCSQCYLHFCQSLLFNISCNRKALLKLG